MYHRLVVKGDVIQAREACTLHGIGFLWIDRAMPGETTLIAEGTLEKVVAWFGEDRAPYPIGSLLFWSEAQGVMS